MRILAVNAATGKVLFDETDTRTMWFLDTTWVEEFKASKGVIVKVTVTHGKSSTSGSITMPDVPGAVENLTVADVTHNSGTLRWDKPAANGGRAIQHYLVGCSGATPMEVTGTSVALTGLTSDLRYDCTVRAKNEIGPGDAKAISFMTSAAPYAPTPPRAVKVIFIPGQQAIATDWQPPADSGRVPITGYASRINWTDGDGVSRSESYEGTMSSVVWKITPLPATRYAVVVTAKNQAGLVSEAAVGSLRTPLKPIARPDTAPSKPLGLEIRAVTHNEMAVVWQPPSSDGGKPLTYYLVEWSRVGDETKRSAMLTADEMTMTLVGLEPGTRYTVAVKALNKEGASPAATAVGETTAKPAPEPVKPDAPENVAVLARSTDFIGLTWRPPAKDGGAPVIGYSVTDESGRIAQGCHIRGTDVDGSDAGA
ncbi:MAG: fibronectin type III domain-containing protein [Actinobacteria bacterium]|nr:fibronectin type III domain-containing protein [Actinomycetota bacterium]